MKRFITQQALAQGRFFLILMMIKPLTVLNLSAVATETFRALRLS